MKKHYVLCAALVAGPALAGGKADPVLAKFMVDEVEQRSDHQQAFSLQGWLGTDLNKLWLKAEREAHDGSTEDAELQLLYSRAIAPYWDLQGGLRRSFSAEGSNDSVVIGIQGLAPYHVEVDAAVFINDQAELSAELELSYELRLTQRWILEPEITLEAAAQGDSESGAGLRREEHALRLYYYPEREWAPYIGAVWQQLYGDTADIAQRRGTSRQQEQFVVGVRAWF
ncbi:copper resistance protein B [Spongiibacter marinus]|uniref:copper resistance protein B n=1 Tax=Spongiibacter marinus TaxID=354246 RepID=UPI0004163EA7|nr:copper resistance protein B [Spongiibacter marinus]